MIRPAMLIHLTAAFLVLFCTSAFAAEEQVNFQVQPDSIIIDALYNGTTLTVTGNIPADSEVVARFVGTSTDLHMKEKGKVFGLLWMNLESLTFKNVPNICIVCTSKDLKDGTSSPNPALQELELSGLKSSVQVESAANIDPQKDIEELVKLKQGEGLYRELAQKLTYEASSPGMKTFKTTIPVPSRLSPGNYIVEVAAVRSDEIVARASMPVNAALTGFPALLSTLAFGNGAMYGILATVIAVLAGLGIGLVFQSKGAH